MTTETHTRPGVNLITVAWCGADERPASRAQARCECGWTGTVRHWERTRDAAQLGIDDAIAHRYASPVGCLLALPPLTRVPAVELAAGGMTDSSAAGTSAAVNR